MYYAYILHTYTSTVYTTDYINLIQILFLKRFVGSTILIHGRCDDCWLSTLLSCLQTREFHVLGIKTGCLYKIYILLFLSNLFHINHDIEWKTLIPGLDEAVELFRVDSSLREEVTDVITVSVVMGKRISQLTICLFPLEYMTGRDVMEIIPVVADVDSGFVVAWFDADVTGTLIAVPVLE